MGYFFLETHVLLDSNDLGFLTLQELHMKAFVWKNVGDPTKHTFNIMVTLKS